MSESEETPRGKMETEFRRLLRAAGQDEEQAKRRALHRYLAVHDGMFSHVSRVYPGHEDYDTAHEALSSAKAELVGALTRNIRELRGALAHVRSLKIADIRDDV